MNIVVDQNIPLIDKLFLPLGNVKRLPGREIKAYDLIDADVLLVRSVTQVDKSLLSESAVKFVGSCTIGIDHLDQEFLKQAGIRWTYAPGCNTNAVIQYVLSALAYCKPHWQQQTLGIIGCGNIGGKLYRLMKQLGVNCICYDPFLSLEENKDLVTLEEVLSADNITCHVPLTTTGPHPTWHLLGREQLSQLNENSLLINSSRGGVIDEAALLSILASNPYQVVLDVWENEPAINETLLSTVALATPHIAGHSLEGKQRGSVMVYQSLCAFLSQSAGLVDQAVNRDKETWIKPASFGDNESTEDQLNKIILSCYAIAQDSQRLKNWNHTADNMPYAFDQLRKNYPVRREYSYYDFSALTNIDLQKRLTLFQ